MTSPTRSRALTILLAGLLIVMNGGAGLPPRTLLPYKPSSPKDKDKDKAWIEAKNVCIFRLGDGRMPRNAGELSAALEQGWKGSITLPDPSRAIVIQGNRYPSLDTLRIDFSDGVVNTESKKEKVEVNNKVERNLQISHLEVRGQPMLVEKARLNMKLTADGAKVAMERDKHGHPVMMLSQARSGTLSFDVTRADAEALMLKNAREMASKFGIAVDRMDLTIVPESPRELQASLHVSTRVAFLPAGMLFRAHVAVDPSMNAKISGLTCDGDELLGPLIVQFLRPALARYNGTTRPLVSFPTGDMKLRDVAVQVDCSLHLTAAFGS